MTPIQGLTILRLDRRARRLTLASWHSPHSLTWRWLVDVSWGWRWKAGGHVHRNPSGSGSWSAWSCCVGLNGHWQQPMWFRDIYTRERDIEDIRSGMMWVSDRHPLAHYRRQPKPPTPTAHGTSTVQ